MDLARLLRHAAVLAGGVILTAVAAPTLRIPAGVDASPWDSLLKKYVSDRGLVAYAAWKNSLGDMAALDAFLDRFARDSGSPATGPEEIAALINLYNACTIRWILQNYPTASIRELDDSWGKARWKLGGRTVSLDEIEHRNLRPLYGWKVHATIVCAARSCPPLQREAYTAANLVTLTERAFRTWLGRDDLNRYDRAANRVAVSAIFKWFKADFTGPGALPRVLATFGPAPLADFFRRGDFRIAYQDYNWGLNDAGTHGAGYSPSWFKRLL